MLRETTYEVPTDHTQFSPEQMRPRTVLTLSFNALARWFAEHLVSFSKLVNEHLTSFVFTTVRLDYHVPDLQFADADWLVVNARVAVSDSGKYLRLAVDIHSRQDHDSRAARPVASLRTDLRIVTVMDDLTLTATPGILPGELRMRFLPGEVYRTDRAEIALAATPPDGDQIFTGPGREFALFRSDCEVADQWSFIEVMEKFTAAREHLYLDPATPSQIGKLAVARPLASITAVFNRAMFVYDTCSITTRVLTAPDQDDEIVFAHTLVDPRHRGTCVTAWEVLRPGSGGPQRWADPGDLGRKPLTSTASPR